MNLTFAATIAILAFGHLLAVSVHLARGTLDGPVPLLVGIGAVLAVPSWWLAARTSAWIEREHEGARPLSILNAVLVVVLLALGPSNAPLAVPGLLNIGYAWHRRPGVGRCLALAMAAVTAFLLVGSLVFLASGRSFEEFRGLE